MKPDTKMIARELLAAHDQGTTIAPPGAANAEFDWADAYAVAAEIFAMRRARGERPVGRKIGFTNRNIWAEYGATSPIWAHVYDTTLSFASDNRARLSLANSASPRIEPEIAFKLAAPIPFGLRDPAQILRSIEWFAPSFEIVDCHFDDWKFKSADSAVDQSFHWRLVIGTPHPVAGLDTAKLAAQIRDCRLALSCNGEIRDNGVGSNALDHPALALAFLVDILARQPQFPPLAAGEIITTGTLTAALPIHAGETWTSTISGLPVEPLTLEFSA
jgi:2-keto-4-pentenoate hydratase